MNAFKTHTLIACVMFGAATSAFAIEAERDMPVPPSMLTRADVTADRRGADQPFDDVPVPRSTLSRAEVLADLEVWQQSGLAALQHGEPMADVFGTAYRQAEARYAALRSEPQFAQRVARIARQRGDTLRIAAQ